MNNRIVKYFSPSDVSPFIIVGNKLFPNLDEVEDKDINKWCELYKIEVPDSVEVRYSATQGIEFFAETITMSGVSLDKETGKLSLDLDGLETVIAQIPLRRIQFENTFKIEEKEATDEE